MKRAIQEHGKGKVLETVVEIQERHDAAKELVGAAPGVFGHGSDGGGTRWMILSTMC